MQSGDDTQPARESAASSTRASNPSWRQRCVATLLSAFLGWICIELILRCLSLPKPEPSPMRFVGDALKWDIYEPDPVLFWRLKASGPNANRLNLRGYDPAPVRGDRDLRVACVGASVTFGLYLPFDAAYGMRLEYLLQHELPGARVETLLAGLPGYTTYQDRRLFERHLVDFAPDYTVLYCGTWNDFMPAVERSDRELGRGEESALRTVRILTRVVRGIKRMRREREVVDLEKLAMPASVSAPPDGRRVSIDEFRDNMEAMIKLARQSGEVILVVPAIAADALQKVPVAISYRDAVVAVARENHVPLVDGSEVVSRFMARPADLQPCTDPAPCLKDWVHLNAVGHDVIARALFEVIGAQPSTRLRTLRTHAADTDRMPEVRSITPASIEPFAMPNIVLEGAGMASRTAVDRVWIGGHLARHEVIDDQRLRCELEAPLPPGEHEILLVGANGAVTADVHVVVPPPSLKAVVTRSGGGLHLEVSGTAPPRSRILVWLRPGRASAPLATQCGAFVLADDERREYGPPDWFCFKKLSLLTIAAVNDATPAWQASHEGELPDGMQEISLQALITSQSTSALSEPVTLRLTP